MATFYIFSFVLLVILLYKIIHPVLSAILEMYLSRRALQKTFPAPPYHWFWGHFSVGGLRYKVLMDMIQWSKIYPKCYALYIGPLRNMLNLIHPEVLKDILHSDESKYYGPGPGFYVYSQKWIGAGILNSDGKKWFRNRRLLMPAFHFVSMKGYVKIFDECAQVFVDRMSRVAKQGGPVEIFKPVGVSTLQSLLQCAFSYNNEVPIPGGNERYQDIIDNLNSLIQHRIYKFWLNFDAIYYRTAEGRKFLEYCNVTADFAKSVIRERRHSYRQKPTQSSKNLEKTDLDFLDILLLATDDAGNGLSEQEILDECQTFFFAGFDTTKSAISFLLYNLASNPSIQERARKEVDELLDAKRSNTIDQEDIHKLQYVTMCVKESLRLYPPVAATTRKTSSTMVIDGKQVAPKSMLFINVWCLHHNEAIWGTDHMDYKPERFSPAKAAQMDPQAFMPFLTGPRNCIGQNFAMNEMKVYTARILQNFILKVHESSKLDFYYEATLKNRDGLYLIFEKRHGQ